MKLKLSCLAIVGFLAFQFAGASDTQLDYVEATKGSATITIDVYGSGDDEIQQAIDFASPWGKVELYGESFNLAQTVSIESDGVTFDGRGAWLNGGLTVIPLQIGTTTPEHTFYVTVENLKITGGTPYLIYLKSLDGCKLENIDLHGNAGYCDTSILADGVNSMLYERVRVIGYANFGLHHISGNNVTVNKCYFNEYNPPYDGTAIRTEYGVNFQVINSCFENGYRFVQFVGSWQSRLIGSYFEGGRDADVIINTLPAEVTGNWFNGNHTAKNAIWIIPYIHDVSIRNNFGHFYLEETVKYDSKTSYNIFFEANIGME